jgi:hypothetical protein
VNAIAYQLKGGARLSGIPIQTIGEELERIRLQNDGWLTPAMTLEASRSENAVLHSFFEWDDTEAAERYRLDQARYVIRSVEVESIYEDGPTDIRAFVEVREGKVSRFISISEAMSSVELRQQQIEEALRQLNAWRRKWEVYTELGSVFAAIDSLTDG